jgi:hypothetical protein
MSVGSAGMKKWSGSFMGMHVAMELNWGKILDSNNNAFAKP